MLYLFYGSDIKNAREKVRDLVASLLKRKPDASRFRLDKETFTEDAFKEYLGSQGLFSLRCIVVLDRVFESEEGRESVVESVKDMSSSNNIFILLESDIDAKTLPKLTKYSEKIQEFTLDAKGSVPKSDFNIFSLTDAIGNRDTKRAWVVYQKALRFGSAPEEIHGMIFWQIKTMLMVSKHSTTGLKPFVVSKARRFLNKWDETELEAFSSKLVRVYHDAHLGKFNLEIGLEQLLLNP